MARKIAVAILFLATLTGCRRELSPEAAKVLSVWLRQSCSAGEQAQLEAQLRRFSSDLEPRLIEAFENGPPKAETDRVVEEAQKQISQVGIGKRSEPRKESLTERLNRVRANYIDGYRSAALAGLGVIDSRKGRQLLQRIATDPQSPYQEVASEALKKGR